MQLFGNIVPGVPSHFNLIGEFSADGELKRFQKRPRMPKKVTLILLNPTLRMQREMCLKRYTFFYVRPL